MPARNRAQVYRRTQTPHPVRRLPVEKLQLPDLREDLCAPSQEVLRD